MPRYRNRDAIHPELPTGWPRPGQSGLDPMQNYSNAGRFTGLVLARAFSRPLRPKGPYSATIMLLAGLALLAFTVLAIASVITAGPLDFAARGITIAAMLLLVYGSVLLTRGGITGLIATVRRHRHTEKHPHRGPASPH